MGCEAAAHWLQEKNKAIGSRGCDAAAKSFICPAGRLSINEVVKGGTSVAEEKGKG